MAERIRWEDAGYCWTSMRNAIVIVSSGAVYFPITKAANTSIKHALLLEPWGEALSKLKTMSNYDAARRKERADEMMITTYLDEGLSQSLDKLHNISTLDDLIDSTQLRHFTVVRNPIDRFVSSWKDKVLSPFTTELKKSLRVFHGDEEATSFSIDELIAYGRHTPISEIESHLKPQWALCGAGRIELVIGKVECLQEDFARFADMGLVDYQSVSRLTVRNTTNITVDLTDEQKRAITAIYERDFELLGY